MEDTSLALEAPRLLISSDNFESSLHLDQEVPDILRAWELDPKFRDCTRAIPVADYVMHSSFASPALEDVISGQKTFDPVVFRDSYSTDCNIFEDTPKSGHSCPDRPLYLKPTHLRLRICDDHKDADAIVHIIQLCLESFDDFDFSFVPNLMTWKGKYLQGCTSCDIRIHLYCDVSSTPMSRGDNVQYIIEAYRIRGEPKPFYEFFRDFKQKILLLGGSVASRESSMGNFTLTSCEDDCSTQPTPFEFVSDDPLLSSSLSYSSSHPQFSTLAHVKHNGTKFAQQLSSSMSAPILRHLSPSPFFLSSTSLATSTSPAPSASQLTPSASHFVPTLMSPSPRPVSSAEDFIATLTPIVTMAVSPLYEAQLEAARMLWDVGVHHDLLLLGDSPTISCIGSLLERLIVHTVFHRVREQAIVTLARFIDIPGYAQHVVTYAPHRMWLLLAGYVANAPEKERAYDSAQLRRESAYILAALVACDANLALQKLSEVPGTVDEEGEETANTIAPTGTGADAPADTTTLPASTAPFASSSSFSSSSYSLEGVEFPVERGTHGDVDRVVELPTSLPRLDVSSWLHSFDRLTDARLKAQAYRIRDGLTRALRSPQHQKLKYVG